MGLTKIIFPKSEWLEQTASHTQQSPFSHLLITHSYLCSVLFTRSLKQVLMKTKRNQAGRGWKSIYCKDPRRPWWTEGASSCCQQLAHEPDEPGCCTGWAHVRRLSASSQQQSSVLLLPSSHAVAKNRSFLIFFFFSNDSLDVKNRSSITVEGPRRAL